VGGSGFLRIANLKGNISSRRGHELFANNPVHRGETIGSYALVFNALINFGHLR
jgi:hypothetical protein